MGEKYNATDRCSSLDRLLSRNGTVLIRGDAPLRRGLDRILTADLPRHLKYQSVRYSFTVVIISTGQMRAVFYWDFNRKKRLIRFGSLLQLPQYPLAFLPFDASVPAAHREAARVSSPVSDSVAFSVARLLLITSHRYSLKV